MPWVPRELYDVMVDAVRRAQAPLPSPVGTVEEAPLEAQRTPNPPAAGSTPALGADVVDLPRMVQDAIAMYAFGDPVEAAANYARAVALHQAGKPAADIVREIRQGGAVELFV